MLASFLPYFNAVRTTITVLMTDFSAKFKDPLLREAFNFILYEKHPAFPSSRSTSSSPRTPTSPPASPKAAPSVSPSRSRPATDGSAARSRTTRRSTP